MSSNAPFLNVERPRERSDKEMISRRMVYAMFSLALITLVLVAISTFSGRAPTGQPTQARVLSTKVVTLWGDGVAARVEDSRGQVVLDTDNGAFISVVIDGLERARKVAGVSGNPPVELTRYSDGRLNLTDPASGWSVELQSFGQGNLRYWTQIMDDQQK